MVIHVVTPENVWPLPWYLRRFRPSHIGYWPDPAAWSDESANYPPPSVIILTPESQPTVDAHLRAQYNRQMMFGLRPGVFLSVYVRDDLWQAFVGAGTRD
jgi:predicted membrane-bound mannosyltransferase